MAHQNPKMTHKNLKMTQKSWLGSCWDNCLFGSKHCVFGLQRHDFWNFGTYQFSKSVCFLILNNFSKNGAPGQSTMLMRRAVKFCVERRSPFSKISHHDPKTLGKSPSIVSWPECQCFLGSLGSYGI